METGCSLEDLFGGIDDEDGCQEREREREKERERDRERVSELPLLAHIDDDDDDDDDDEASHHTYMSLSLLPSFHIFYNLMKSFTLFFTQIFSGKKNLIPKIRL